RRETICVTIRHPATISSSFRNWSSPRKVDRGLRVYPFVLCRGDIPQRRVAALVVVEDFDVLDDRRTGLRAGGEVSVLDQLFLQRSKEALHRGVIPAVGTATHAAGNAVPGQEALVMVAGVLAAPVGMSQQPLARQAPLHRERQGIDHQTAL